MYRYYGFIIENIIRFKNIYCYNSLLQYVFSVNTWKCMLKCWLSTDVVKDCDYWLEPILKHKAHNCLISCNANANFNQVDNQRCLLAFPKNDYGKNCGVAFFTFFWQGVNFFCRSSKKTKETCFFVWGCLRFGRSFVTFGISEKNVGTQIYQATTLNGTVNQPIVYSVLSHH